MDLLVEATVFLKNVSDFQSMNEVYAKLSIVVEEVERDRIGHRLLPGIARMQVFPAVVGGQHACGMRRVADGGVEIDDPVIGVCRADPMVHRLPLYLLFRRIVARNCCSFVKLECCPTY